MTLIKSILVVSAFFTSLLLSGCTDNKSAETVTQQTPSINKLFEDYHQFKLSINPFEGTNAGIEGYNDKLVNFIAKDVQSELIVKYSKFLKAIDSIDQSALSDSDRISLQVMQWDCELKKEGLENPLVTVASPMFDLPNFSLMPINQIFSFHLYINSFGEVGGAQPFNNTQDYENWLARVNLFLDWLKTAQANMQEGVALGVVMPKAIIKKVIAQLDQFTHSDLEEHIFYAAIKNMPAEISMDDRAKLDAAYQAMITEQLIPTYQQLKKFLEETYLPAGTQTAGIGALPHGLATYQYLIKYHTSTNMTPDEIFALGQSEVDRIRSEMEKVKEQVDFKGDLKAFFTHVRNSKEQMPYTEPQQVIDNFNEIHHRMKENLDKLFDMKPKANFEVRRTQAFREASASAEYLSGSIDGTRPGIFYVPIPDVTAYNKYAAEALFLHEAIPGHHYQLSLQQENKNLPSFLHTEGMGIYVEGWALYAESLGKELGLYTDPYQYFGMLGMEMHRAIRLVVDSGIHAKGWSREQAIQYSMDNEAESEASIIAEIERYMIAPGQALAYKVGQLKIRELRAKAEKAFGKQFDIKAFHNQILGSGSLPLMLLEAKIHRWIEVQNN